MMTTRSHTPGAVIAARKLAACKTLAQAKSLQDPARTVPTASCARAGTCATGGCPKLASGLAWARAETQSRAPPHITTCVRAEGSGPTSNGAGSPGRAAA